MYEVIEDIRARFKEKGMFEDGSIKLCVGYGHVGDGNIHLNVVANKWDSKVEDVLEPWVYEWVSERKGSISAEHGLGVMKAPHIGYSQSDEAISLMRTLKKAIDPKNIMNPYKYFLDEKYAPQETGVHTAEPGH
ncbi:D-lactate ferricytochrome c oxidoreductase [Cystobasidiomycetes sp. EMM_F5]